MHHIHHTEGIIFGSKNFGEAGRYYYIFTRDLGMVYASAQGVRKMSSKLRFVLHDFAYVKVDLVQGKDFWRVTSATKTNTLEQIIKQPEHFEVFANISRLLKRLLTGTATNEILFADLLNGLSSLEKSKTIEDLHNLEIIIVLRILHNLGYIGGNATLQTFIQSPLEEEMVFEISKNRGVIISEINKALKETHL